MSTSPSYACVCVCACVREAAATAGPGPWAGRRGLIRPLATFLTEFCLRVRKTAILAAKFQSMEIRDRVLESLKSKASGLGFSAKEIESAAEAIVGNLKLGGDMGDEERAAAADAATEAILPFLRLSQAAATRIVAAQRARRGAAEEGAEEGGGTDGGGRAPAEGARGGRAEKPKADDEMPPWAVKLIGSVAKMGSDLEGMKRSKAADARRGRLEALLKDAGAFGRRTLRSLDRMTFDDDEDFEAFSREVEEDLKAYNQERADAGLGGLGNPPPKAEGAGGTITDAQIEAVAGKF